MTADLIHFLLVLQIPNLRIGASKGEDRDLVTIWRKLGQIDSLVNRYRLSQRSVFIQNFDLVGIGGDENGSRRRC